MVITQVNVGNVILVDVKSRKNATLLSYKGKEEQKCYICWTWTLETSAHIFPAISIVIWIR